MRTSCQYAVRATRKIRRFVVDLKHEAGGAVAVEYGLLAALIAVAILGTLVELGENLLALPLQTVIDALTG